MKSRVVIKQKKAKKHKKFVLDTKKPLGSPSGLRVALGATMLISIAIETQVTPSYITTGNITGLAYPLLINIIPAVYPVGKWINLNIINHREYRALKKIINAKQLVDYGDKSEKTIFGLRKIKYGVKVVYQETDKGVKITFYPNGIKHRDEVAKLGSRLEEAFNMNVLSVDSDLDSTTYMLSDVNHQKMEVREDDF